MNTLFGQKQVGSYSVVGGKYAKFARGYKYNLDLNLQCRQARTSTRHYGFAKSTKGINVGKILQISRQLQAQHAFLIVHSRAKEVIDNMSSVLSSLDLFEDSPDDQQQQQQALDEVTAELSNILHEHSSAVATVGRAVYEVLRVDSKGKVRRINVKRRDLMRSNKLQARDLRRIDPSLSVTRTSPTMYVKESALIINLGGVRLVADAERMLLFESESKACKKFLEVLVPRLESSAAQTNFSHRLKQKQSHMDHDHHDDAHPAEHLPFELEVIEAALIVATGRLDGELLNVTKRVSNTLQKLPRQINPVNLEELRRIKQVLVELKTKADSLRELLEEVMDDDDELREFNLSSRPRREERRRNREREKIQRDLDMAETWNMNSLNQNGAQLDVVALNKLQQQYKQQQQEGLEDSMLDAQDALEEMKEKEEEDREVEEVEDLFEYYLQRAATTSSEADRLLAGARDLEESIGVSLSARRFEVNRLELILSIGSFAAALGAMIAGIFGMNLRSTLEMSVFGFWSLTGAIVLACVYVYVAIFRWTKRKRIL
eukprot:TRINITY_DN16890_c1_g1_i3.p1 TRINITY_DN16890_c1_g1~~TRINITY_DN16890_c1_g1_i3.p1  ORF type:complete len:546 (-),score=69.89 TRINITY_DN16890_c1_g1_i3:727-2364(-)